MKKIASENIENLRLIDSDTNEDVTDFHLTDIESVKKVAMEYLYMDLEQLESFDFMIILKHPFFKLNYRLIKDEEGEDVIVDILESEESLDKARKEVSSCIENTKTAIGIMHLITKPYRCAFFKDVYEYLSEIEFSAALSFVWTSSENPNQDPNISINEWIDFFEQANKEMLMSDEDYETYNTIKNKKTITVYRGVGTGIEQYGLSWTDNEDIAISSAKCRDKEIYYLETKIDTENVLAYFNHNDKSELIININNIDKQKIGRYDL